MAEYELGADVTPLAVSRRPPSSLVISTRLNTRDADYVLRMAELYGLRLSEYLRRAALGTLPNQWTAVSGGIIEVRTP